MHVITLKHTHVRSGVNTHTCRPRTSENARRDSHFFFPTINNFTTRAGRHSSLERTTVSSTSRKDQRLLLYRPSPSKDNHRSITSLTIQKSHWQQRQQREARYGTVDHEVAWRVGCLALRSSSPHCFDGTIDFGRQGLLQCGFQRIRCPYSDLCK